MTRSEVSSVLLKLLVTVTTLACLAVLACYHVLDVQLFTINNSMEDWRLALTPRRVVTMVGRSICLICVDCVDWLICGLAGWLVGWLIHSFIHKTIHHQHLHGGLETGAHASQSRYYGRASS
jgi:hypothetical protein